MNVASGSDAAQGSDDVRICGQYDEVFAVEATGVGLMLIRVSGGKARLEDHLNFRDFKIVVDQQNEDWDMLRAVLAGIARVDDGLHGWVLPSALRADPLVAGDAAWQSGFDAMIEKARPHGWIDPQSGEIRAHIVWFGG